MSAERRASLTEASSLTRRLLNWISTNPERPPQREEKPTVPTLLVIHPPAEAFADLEERLLDEIPQLRILTSLSGGGKGASLPPDPNRRSVQRWLEVCNPTVVLYFGSLRVGPMIEALAELQRPVIAANVPGMDRTIARQTKHRKTLRAAIGKFQVSLVQDDTALGTFRTVAPVGARVEVGGRVSRLPDPPDCNAAERDELAQSFRARPVWLAAFPTQEEKGSVLAAHRVALQGAHRLLLIVAVEGENEGSDLAADLRAEGWRVARRGVEGEPDDTIEIFIADTPEEIGLWYRLCPICFLGGTLLGPETVDPSGAASLGSALIAGPHRASDGSEHEAMLQRLVEAGGVYKISTPDDLAPAVAELLSPDRAASHAHAAWDVTSDGTRVLDRIVTEVRLALRAMAS